MATVVVGGSGKNVGKTALVCAVIASLPEFAWTAVKITGHDYEADGSAVSTCGDAVVSVREEQLANDETDTGRYLLAGARRALLVMRAGPDVPMAEIRTALGEDCNVIFESNRVARAIKSDVVLGLMGGGEIKPSFERLLDVADAVVGDFSEDVRVGVRRFRLDSAGGLTPEMVEWMRERLNSSP